MYYAVQLILEFPLLWCSELLMETDFWSPKLLNIRSGFSHFCCHFLLTHLHAESRLKALGKESKWLFGIHRMLRQSPYMKCMLAQVIYRSCFSLPASPRTGTQLLVPVNPSDRYLETYMYFTYSRPSLQVKKKTMLNRSWDPSFLIPP